METYDKLYNTFPEATVKMAYRGEKARTIKGSVWKYYRILETVKIRTECLIAQEMAKLRTGLMMVRNTRLTKEIKQFSQEERGNNQIADTWSIGMSCEVKDVFPKLNA